MKIERIDRVAVSVSNLDEASRFYGDLLATKFENIEVTGSQNVHLKAAVSPLGLELVEQPSGDPKDEHLRSVVFKVPDLQTVQAELAAKGLNVADKVSGGGLDEIVYVERGVRLAFASYEAERETHPAAKAANRRPTNWQ